MKRYGILGLLTVALLIAGCGSGHNNQIVNQPVIGTLTGYVYTASYNNASAARPAGQAARQAAAGVPAGYVAVSGAVVSIPDQDFSTRTDANGYFSLTNAKVGTYTLKIAKDGLQTIAMTVTIGGGTSSLNDQVDAQALAMVPELTGTLVVTATSGGTLAVPVTATVYINNLATSKTTSPAATITDIGPGSYTVTVRADGYNDVTPQSATITAGQTSSVSFQMTPTDGNNVPLATIVTPTANQSFNTGATVTLTGTGVDSEDGNLTGTALLWSSSVDGELGTGTSLQTSSLSVGTHTITLAARDSGGKTGVDTVAIYISSAVAANTAPTATIVIPTASSYTNTQTITFTGAGTDAEDGTLTGSSLVWTSSLDGQLGTGNFFQKSGLSPGTHTITLTATDARGTTGTATVQITVTDASGVNASPLAFITTPVNNQSITTLQTMIFSGAGTDTEDGVLTGASLVWTSSIDGALSTGNYFIKTGMTAGTHTITLTATDSNGATGATSTVLIVTSP